MNNRFLTLLLALNLLAPKLVFGANLAEQCPTGFEAYKKTAYKKIKKDCRGCHKGTNEKAPNFLETPESGYAYLVHTIDFGRLESSPFIERAGNNHCELPKCNTASGKEMLVAVKDWWETGEKNCKRFGSFVAPIKEIPSSLPKRQEGFTTLRWSLSEIDPTLASLDHTYFEIDIQEFESPHEEGLHLGAYRLSRPRFVGKDADRAKDLNVKGIQVLLNGHWYPNANAYAKLDMKISPENIAETTTVAYPVLSAHSLILSRDRKEGDQISVAFDEISIVENSLNCSTLGVSFDAMMIELKAQGCIDCHSGGSGQKHMNLQGTQEALCKKLKARAQSKYLVHSPLIAIPTRGLLGRHPVAPQPQALFKAIRGWVTASP